MARMYMINWYIFTSAAEPHLCYLKACCLQQARQFGVPVLLLLLLVRGQRRPTELFHLRNGL